MEFEQLYLTLKVIDEEGYTATVLDCTDPHNVIIEYDELYDDEEDDYNEAKLQRILCFVKQSTDYDGDCIEIDDEE